MKDYRTELAEACKSGCLSQGLSQHLSSPRMDDVPIEYVHPPIGVENETLLPKKTSPLKPKSIRLPARLNSPLIPYPPCLKKLIVENKEIVTDKYHAHHKSHLNALRVARNRLTEITDYPFDDVRFDTSSLKELIKCEYSHRAELINTCAVSFATRATSHELSIAAMEAVGYHSIGRKRSPYLSFLVIMQRLRALLCTNTVLTDSSEYPLNYKDLNGGVTVFRDGTYSLTADVKGESFAIIVAGHHFTMYHTSLPYWFAGSFSYLDYALTISDTINNLETLATVPSYSWAQGFFRLLIELAELNADHNLVVEFMKSFEGLMLNISDYDEDYPMNWVPLMSVLHEMWGLDKTFSQVTYPFELLVSVLQKDSMTQKSSSYLLRFLHELTNMSRTQVQEVSSLHKFVFYAEVDEMAGLKKYLGRVHTKREVDDQSVSSLTDLAKKEFIQSYARKHKTLPTLRGPNEKIAILRLHMARGQIQKLDAYPLNWWRELQPWCCMDTTLTGNPIELAKDKGALLEAFRCGPGDSRKELLQVIERDTYKLKDLLGGGSFMRQPSRVYRTTQSEKPINHSYPTRLIPKEGEQKPQARLFANGELSNKHALSMITTKMKIVLSYFNEQLMTPPDSKRRLELHRAAQMLTKDDNYSLLLDITGHNQSMQHANTSELLEFMGNLYGEGGWGSLSDYFGALFVYHYDEYKDQVLVSHGQHGGIEGWLNPAWTLHTLLMMKLLRYMTDVKVEKIMVYSDDVNAIISLQQATELTVQSTFSKVIQHCLKFGMTVKFSQTTLSKHRATMLRQHYSDGVRADSTLKRLMAVSGCNNSMVTSEELEVSAICSSASSACDSSNAHEACCYLKNYKLGLLLSRLPHMILTYPQLSGSLSSDAFPPKIAELLYHIKDDTEMLQSANYSETVTAGLNDISKYLLTTRASVAESLIRLGVDAVFGVSVAGERLVDNADRVLYLQIYDDFIRDLLFFWIYLPGQLGGLGGILHINMMLSGHSVGFSKSLHYIHQWITKYCTDTAYFSNYLRATLTNSEDPRGAGDQHDILSSHWSSEKKVTTAINSVKSSIRSLIKKRIKNKDLLDLVELEDDAKHVGEEIVEIFRNNFHPRIAEFYYENSSVHFFDLLVRKIETSTSLLQLIPRLDKLRQSLVRRTIKNIRTASTPRTNDYGPISPDKDIVSYLVQRRKKDFPTISFIEAEEVLYDNRLQRVFGLDSLVTVRKCSPQHIHEGHKVYSDPRLGDEVLYKGEYLDRERLVGNKEELLAAKVVSVTKWLLTKTGNLGSESHVVGRYDCVQACDVVLSTLTGHTFNELRMYCPDETGGEILHRMPNMKFKSKTYIRVEPKGSLGYVAELSQRYIHDRNLEDSNINFDYLRMRLTCAMLVLWKIKDRSSLVTKYHIRDFDGICDVQFVHPKPTEYKRNLVGKSYAERCQHSFSELRFRFFTCTYMNEEDLNELIDSSSMLAARSPPEMGESLMRQVVYKYARSLDKEYMCASLLHPSHETWKPIYATLDNLDRKFKSLTDDEKYATSMKLLESEMATRGRIKLVSDGGKLHQVLQSQCLEIIIDQRPYDTAFDAIVNSYIDIANRQIRSRPVRTRIKEYRKAIKRVHSHQANIYRSILAEIAVTLHFHCTTSNGVMSFSAKKSVDHLIDSGISPSYLQSLSPELFAYSQVIGNSNLKEYLVNRKSDLIELLHEVSAVTSTVDMALPEMSLRTRPVTNLSREAPIPAAAESVVYMMEEIGTSAMDTLSDLQPLISFAERCCRHGSSPAVLESPTGSDTYCCQYALFRLMKHRLGLNKDTRICDLTAGRGDGNYAIRANGLECDSFAVRDLFTSVRFNPLVNYTMEYDITKPSTVEFIKDYDFVHVDVSFMKNSNPELGDLLLMLEDNLLSYSIRLNSVSFNHYKIGRNQLPVAYAHRIAYSMSSHWRTPQFYLIGTPTTSDHSGPLETMKKSLAFKSMSLSFLPLMYAGNDIQVLQSLQTNSVSSSMPDMNDIFSLVNHLVKSSVMTERRYCLTRYLTEFGSDNMVYFVGSCLERKTMSLLHEDSQRVNRFVGSRYRGMSTEDIGNVSMKSRPHLVKHLRAIQDPEVETYRLAVNRFDLQFLNELKYRHPVKSERRKCNLLIGIFKTCTSLHCIEATTLERELSNKNLNCSSLTASANKEITEALNLLIVSAYHGNRTYGLTYCTVAALRNPGKYLWLNRVRNSFKMLSGYHDSLVDLLTSGSADLQTVKQLSDRYSLDTESRTTQLNAQLGSQRSQFPEDSSYLDLDFDMDQLFMKIELGALSTLLQGNQIDPHGSYEQRDPPSRFEVVSDAGEVGNLIAHGGFNFGAELAAGIDRMNLQLDEHTGRYIGFDDEPQYVSDD